MRSGFTLAQAQWLVSFMRNLPGNTLPQATDAAYEDAMRAQRAQAEFQSMNPSYPEDGYEPAYAPEVAAAWAYEEAEVDPGW